MKKLNTEEFIRRATEKHGDFYDYSKSVYTTYRKPVIVICPTHGEFTPLPSNHMKGNGCTACSHDKSRTDVKDFIIKANIVHDNKYYYTKTNITNLNSKVTITCPDHGDFEQRAASHLEGSGCSMCAGVERLTTEQFVGKSNKQHNNKYTYEKVDYVNTHTKVTLTCPEHGDFEQTAGDHLHGYGCAACGGVLKVTNEQFVKNAIKSHGDRYNYDLVEMQGMNTNVDIVCSIHGKFSQRPADHQRGIGCPDCGLSGRGKYSNTYFAAFPSEGQSPGILYLVTIGDDWCKVGITTQYTTKDRFRSRQISVLLEHRTTIKRANEMEQQVLDEFSQHKFKATQLRTERFSGWTECFPIDMLPKIQEYMQGIIK